MGDESLRRRLPFVHSDMRVAEREHLEPGAARDTDLDDEAPAGPEVPRDVLEARDLLPFAS